MGIRSRRITPRSIRLPPRFRRHGLATTVLILVALVALWDRRTNTRNAARQPNKAQDQARYHDRDFKVHRVVDGDTLDITARDGPHVTTRVRLLGVDTPEVAGGKLGEMHFGPEAAAFAEKRLKGRTIHVVLAPGDTRDKFSRLLAYVFVRRGGPMFNEELITGGFAYADRRFDHPYKYRFETLEERARREGRGLWADVSIEDMPPWRRRFQRQP